MFRLDRDNVYRSSLLEDIPWVRHGFGTRGSSEWLIGDSLSSVRQVHSDRILVATGESGVLGEADALITRHPGTLLSIRTADCVPILIADVRNRTVGAVHAGWRGTVSEIAAKTVNAVKREFGSSPEDLLVVIGPAIGPCCFEVGPEVAVQFESLFPERDNSRTRTTLDLVEANCRQLIGAGILPSNLDVLRMCTCCGDVFHSFRRDREDAGRMTSAIGIEA